MPWNRKIEFYAENWYQTEQDLIAILLSVELTNQPSDTEGPEIQLFMNDESFTDGANTIPPNLIAKLADIMGSTPL